MAKHIYFRSEDQKKFYGEFQTLMSRRSSWEVWSDWVEAVAITLSNPFEFRQAVREKRGERIQEIMNRYSEEEQQTFSRMFDILVDALERKPDQDFLGNMFESLNLNSHWKAQFFTPYDVAEAMARIILGSVKSSLEHKNWIDILDPCSGAGVLLVAARNYMVSLGVRYDQVLYVGQDVDQIAALMGYIQISLLGCAGYIVIGNSLSHPVTHMGNTSMLPRESEHYDLWFTPLYRSAVWEFRRCSELLKLQMQDDDKNKEVD